MDWLTTARTPSRRRLLGASMTMLPLLAAASCGVPDPLAGPPGPSRDVRTLRASISAEQALVKEYRKVLGAYPGLSASLRPFLTQHEDHLAQLQSRLIVPPHAAASPPASPAASPPPPPASAGAAVLLLGNAERAAAAAQVRRLAGATPSLAQLLASIAASEATHAVALSALKPAGEPLMAGSGPVPTATIMALQATLAAENAAIYGYGVAGAHLSGGWFAAAQRDWNGHRAAGATLTAMIRRLGAKPAPAADAYRPPFPVSSTRAAKSLAALLEDGVLTAYLGLVALDEVALRTFGAQRMQASAIRAAFWRGSTTAFPGLPASALKR